MMVAVGLVVAAALFVCANGKSTLLHPGPKTVSAETGREVKLDCAVNGAGGKIIWMKGDDHEMISMGGLQLMSDSNLQVAEKSTTGGINLQLTINRFSSPYAGLYFCILDQGEPDWDAKQKIEYTVTVGRPATTAASIKDIQVSADPEVSTARTLTALEGDNAELKCRVKNFEGHSIMWLKRPIIEAVSSELLSIGTIIYYQGGGTKYKALVRNIDSNTQEVTLTINGVTTKDAGKYACSAQVLGMKFDDYPNSEVSLAVKAKEIPKPKICYWKAYENSRLPDVTSDHYQRYIGTTSMLQCMSRCRALPGCLSVSYSSKMFTCFAMKASSGGDVSKIGALKGYLYAELYC